MYLAPISMMHLLVLVLFGLFVSGAARRSIRIGDSHDETQQQTNTLTKALELSTDARESLLPQGFGTALFRHRGPQAGALHATYGQEPRHRAASPRRVGPRHARVTLHAASGPEEEKQPATGPCSNGGCSLSGMYGGLAHVGLLVSDTERSLRFFCDILGMEDETFMRNPKLPFPGAFVRAGAQQIHIMEYGNVGIPVNPDHMGVPGRNEEPLLGRPEHAGRDRHVALTIQDLAPLKQALVDAGVPYTMSKSGRAALFCRDPDGNGIEFMETPNLSESANDSLRRFTEEMQQNPALAAQVTQRIEQEKRERSQSGQWESVDWGEPKAD